MRRALGLFITVCALAVTAEAHGQTIDITQKSSYIFPDLGTVVDSKPVTEIDFSGTSGKFTYGATLFHGPSQYGKEIDLSVAYTTNAGKTQIAISAIDDFLNGDGGMFNIKNNVLELHADFYRPFSKGNVTIGPVFQVVQAIGVRNFPSYTLLQPGVRGEWTPTNKLTIDGDIRHSFEPARHRSNWRMNVGATYMLSSHLSVQAEVEHVDKASALNVTLSYQF